MKSFTTLLMQTILQDGHNRSDILANRDAHLHLGLIEAFLDAAKIPRDTGLHASGKEGTTKLDPNPRHRNPKPRTNQNWPKA